MKVLQLVSDWKWTGPAEPMLLGLVALRERGHDVRLACPEPPLPGERSLAERARAAGIEPALELDRGRGIHPFRDAPDGRRLRDLVEAQGTELIHAWHSRCHALALRAAGMRPESRRLAVVRSVSRAEAPAAWPWNRWLFGPGCDGLHCPSPGSADAHAALRPGRPTLGCLGAVDHPSLGRADRSRGRRALGLGARAPVVGIAARVQPHRRFDLLLAALERARRREPSLRLLILGRGTRLDEVARRPAVRLGLRDHVVFGGYRTGDYADALAAADLFTYVVPGSDGTCRALLEAQALGLPAVVSRRAALPEIVVDGETGRVVDETPEAFADAWLDALADRPRLARWGAAARARARAHFTPARWAEDVEGLYERALGEVRGG
ncbi:MAG: glycosyltransferase family 4 protein [Myxococcota bacterium]